MNPAGVLVDGNVYMAFSELGVPIISDEIYDDLVYEGRIRSILEFSRNAFALSGFSRKFAMAGLRPGYLIAPKKYMRLLQVLQYNLFICAPSACRKGGVAALNETGVEVE